MSHLREARGSRRFKSCSALRSSTAALDAFDLDQLEVRRSTSSSASGSCTGSRTRSACSRCCDGASRPKAGCFFETYGSADRTLEASAAIHVYEAGEVYARDDFVYWGFTPAGLDAMARDAGFEAFEVIDAPLIDGHPRIIGTLRASPVSMDPPMPRSQTERERHDRMGARSPS